jgi:hypothetical protein
MHQTAATCPIKESAQSFHRPHHAETRSDIADGGRHGAKGGDKIDPGAGQQYGGQAKRAMYSARKPSTLLITSSGTSFPPILMWVTARGGSWKTVL